MHLRRAGQHCAVSGPKVMGPTTPGVRGPSTEKTLGVSSTMAFYNRLASFRGYISNEMHSPGSVGYPSQAIKAASRLASPLLSLLAQSARKQSYSRRKSEQLSRL